MALTAAEINKINDLYKQVDVLVALNATLKEELVTKYEVLNEKVDRVLAAVEKNCKKSR